MVNAPAILGADSQPSFDESPVEATEASMEVWNLMGLCWPQADRVLSEPGVRSEVRDYGTCKFVCSSCGQTYCVLPGRQGGPVCSGRMTKTAALQLGLLIRRRRRRLGRQAMCLSGTTDGRTCRRFRRRVCGGTRSWVHRTRARPTLGR